MAKQINCQDAGTDCDFMIRSENEDELIEFVQQHAQNAHDMDVSRSDARGMMKES